MVPDKDVKPVTVDDGADWMHPWSPVLADGGQEAEPYSVVVEQPSSRFGHGWRRPNQVYPSFHGHTIAPWYDSHAGSTARVRDVYGPPSAITTST